MDEEAAADLEVGAPLTLKKEGPGYAALLSSGCADDSRAVAWGQRPFKGQAPRRRSGYT